MAGLALVGAPTKPLSPINAFDFTFSQPFTQGSDVLTNASTRQQRDHSIPSIPPSKPIFVDAASGAKITWHGVHDYATKVALGLRNLLSAETGPYESVSSVVLVHLPNSIQFTPIVLGIFGAGFTASLANPILTSTELQHIISLARPAAIITTKEGWFTIKAALKAIEDRSLATKLTTQGRIFTHDPYSTSSAVAVGYEGTRPFDQLLAPVAKDFEATKLTEHSYRKHTALILWSSGTTGKSKGVRLSHEAIIHNSEILLFSRAENRSYLASAFP